MTVYFKSIFFDKSWAVFLKGPYFYYSGPYILQFNRHGPWLGRILFRFSWIMNREQVHVHATFHGFLSNHIYVHATFSKNFVSMPHSWPWLEHSCPFSPCPYPPHSALLLERVIQWPIFIEVNHYINTLSHKDFPWLGHGTDFFLRFLNQDCSKNYRYLRFSHYAHVILHIENLRKKHHEGNQLFKKKRTRHASFK